MISIFENSIKKYPDYFMFRLWRGAKDVKLPKTPTERKVAEKTIITWVYKMITKYSDQVEKELETHGVRKEVFHSLRDDLRFAINLEEAPSKRAANLEDNESSKDTLEETKPKPKTKITFKFVKIISEMIDYMPTCLLFRYCLNELIANFNNKVQKNKEICESYKIYLDDVITEYKPLF